TGRLLEEGTPTRPADALAEAIEDVGGTLDLGATGASLRGRAGGPPLDAGAARARGPRGVPRGARPETLPLALEILADVIRSPAFPEAALGWTRRRIAAELQGDRDDPAYRADLLFRGLVYGGR